MSIGIIVGATILRYVNFSLAGDTTARSVCARAEQENL